MNQGVRPNKLWHWFAIAFLTATFLAEPRAFLAVTWQIFRASGQLGGELLTGEPEPDPLNLTTDPPLPGDDAEGQGDDVESQGRGGNDNRPGDPPDPPAGDAAPTYRVDGDTIRAALDAGTDTVLDLHGHVTDAYDNGGVTVELGDSNGGRS